MNWKNARPPRQPWLVCLLVAACLAGVHAQSAQPGLVLTTYTARVWRHTPKLTTRTGETLFGAEAALHWQTRGARNWQAWHRYPAPGVALGYFELGAYNHGAAAYGMPFLDIPVWRSAALDVLFRLGAGLAYVDRPYDSFTNPTENALGSHWNNMTQFRLGAAWRATRRLHVSAGGALLHFSNGGSTVPNFGVNLPAAWAGVVYWPTPFDPATWTPASASRRADRRRRWGGLVQFGATRVEYEVPDGPKYFFPHAAAAVLVHLNRTNRLLAGVDYEFNFATYRWGLFTAQFDDVAAARRGATRIGVFLADEFRFGPLGVEARIGQYVGTGRGFNQFVLAPRYRKLGLRYYLPPVWTAHGPRPFAGIVLKDHKFVAEYIAVQVGVGW